MEEPKSRSRQHKIRLIAGLFVALLVGFTLAGNSLRALTMPKVYLALATPGEVTHDYDGSATIQPGGMKDIANPAGWKVTKVLVKQGDKVHQGQPLIEYDASEALQQLADMQSDLKKLNLSLDQLHANFITAASGGDESAKINARVAIETAKLDIATQQQHMEQLKDSIAEDRQVVAPFAGIVMNIHAVPGLVSGGEPDISLSNLAKGYQISLIVPGDVASLLGIGDTLDQITLIGPKSRQLSGTISAIEEQTDSGGLGLPTGGDGFSSNKTEESPSSVTVTFKSGDIQAGERVGVKISKSDAQKAVTVANATVHHDEQGNYVYTLRAEEGPLGNAYYVVRTPIKIASANQYVTAVSEGLYEQQEVVIDSTAFLIDGVRVRR